MKEKKLEEIYFFLLESTVRQFRKFSQREFAKREIDISGEQWVILKRTRENPGLTQKELAETTYKDPASVTRMIDLLEKRNFVERKSSLEDRRSYGIYLTDEGQDFVDGVLPLAKEMREYGLKGVSEKDRIIFVDVLKKIYTNLE